MRNGQQIPQQDNLSQSIEITRALMQQFKNSTDKQAILAQILQNNPNATMIINVLKNNGSLESLAYQIAQQKGYDINDVLKRLGGI